MARTEIMYVAGGSGGERGRQRPRPVRDAMCRVRSTELAIIRVTPRRDTGVTAASGGRYLGITLPSPPRKQVSSVVKSYWRIFYT